MAINVNMFGERCTIDCQPRSKNGQPHQSTTGVAIANSSQRSPESPIQLEIGLLGSMLSIAITNTGTLSARLTQKRRDMSTSSGFTSSSALIVIGSSAIPQMGQLPG